ncbi:hypothetical protein LCGC14_0764180 [marine sediment metagenome]|uniref:Uncharacterized protein n=1 Tax=marine sediment metagenome TaxID=412755 RepID=A0A0F9QK17_9ZZZZ
MDNTIFTPIAPSKFIVRNRVSKAVMLFGQKVEPGGSYDLMTIPHVSESDIQHSLLKGTLRNKLSIGEIRVTESNINLVQYSPEFTIFLQNVGISLGISSINETCVNNLTELSQVNDVVLPTGAALSIASLLNIFILDKTSTDTTDGITIVATSSGTGRWLRNQGGNIRWAKQLTWYVDADDGNDENDGNTDTTALATLSEYFRRVSGITIKGAVTIQMLTDSSDAYVLVNSETPEGITIQGIRTVVATGTLTNVQAYNYVPGAAQRGEITDTSMDFSTHVLRRIILTSGASVGAYAWIIKDLGSNSCVISPWIAANGFSEATPAITDDYEIVTQSTISGVYANQVLFRLILRDLKIISPGASYWWIGSIQCKGSYISLNGCEITAPDPQGPALIYWGLAQITGCCFHDFQYDIAFRTAFGLVDFYGCACVRASFGSANTHSDSFEFFLIPSVTLVEAGESWPINITRNSECIIATPVMWITVDDVRALTMKASSTCNIIQVGKILSVGGADGYGVSLSPGCTLTWYPSAQTASQVFDFDGGAGDFIIGGTTKTLAELGSTGYVDLVADPNTGVISGTGARVLPTDDTW